MNHSVSHAIKNHLLKYRISKKKEKKEEEEPYRNRDQIVVMEGVWIWGEVKLEGDGHRYKVSVKR